MTVEDVLNIVTRATLIKKWRDEYRVYSEKGIVFIYRDNEGMPTHYVYSTDGEQYPFSEFESKMLSQKLESRYVALCKLARERMANQQNTK